MSKFKCPKCKKINKLGKLRSSYTCPNCHADMLLNREDKARGYKIFKRFNIKQE